MRRPSTQWAKCRQATLERVVRMTTDPIRPLYTLFTTLCLIYLAGFVRFSLLPVQSNDFSWIDVGQVLSTALSGVLIPFLAGPVVLLMFISSRIENLLHEFD